MFWRENYDDDEEDISITRTKSQMYKKEQYKC